MTFLIGVRFLIGTREYGTLRFRTRTGGSEPGTWRAGGTGLMSSKARARYVTDAHD